ncbi:MAG TPA: efflux RND transporter periplasmic adaptor subunit [Burkholderiaceae bacterium]|jgi:HlyD family secretion protein|nr:efflux RND transporter periplasmic adaptor subunit [Burkholderiaceae bacterium]
MTTPKRRPWRWLIVLLVLAALAAGGFTWYRQTRQGDVPQWRTAKVSRGGITASVSATGTLNAEVSVPVGSQVSGQVKEVLADFNSEVKRGQLIARIDPETFEYRVRQSQADLDAARAQVLTAQANISAASAAVSRIRVNLAEARRDLDRKQLLVERSFISGAELDKARAVLDAATEEIKSGQAQVEVAQAQARSAQAVVAQREAQLLQARADLERTAIRAPVDGIVIKRSVDAGQTVAASLQAPELFVIARNLRDMQVDTSIDEAEIGKVRLGQRATFTVDSYPGRSFSGEVKQVRKAALTVQNVVTYTVVVATANPDLALIPGMTANVRLVTDARDGVLRVPNAALRFRPPDWQEPAPGTPGSGGTGGAPASKGAGAAAPGRPDGWAGQALAAAWPPSWLLAWLPQAHAQGAGGALGQFRERLERDLALSDDQKSKLDGIFATMRDKFIAARQASDDERPALIDKTRAELRDRIGQILTAQQQKRYQEILAEIAARQAGGGTGAAAGGAAGGAATAAGTAAAGAATAPGPAPGAAAASAPGAPGATSPAPQAGGSSGPGGALRQFRDRLERELALTDDQRTQMDAIFGAMREKFAALRDAPEGERAKMAERNRTELRERIADILNPDQKKKYAEIIADIAGRQSSRGRLFVLDAGGALRAVAVRTGLTDGAFTEVSGEGLKEGDTIVVGVQTSGASAPKSTAPTGPRLPF